MFKRLLNLFESQKNLQIMLSSGSGSPGKGSGNVGGGGGSKGTPPKKRFTFTKPGNSSGKVMVNDVYLFLQYFHKLDYLSSFRCIDGPMMDAIRGGVFLAIVMLIEDFTFGLRTLNSLKQMPSVPHSGPRLTIDVKDLRGTGMVATGG